MKCARHLRRTSQPLEQTVHSAWLVAHFILGLYPISDLARRLEAPLRHLLCQSPFFLCAQITRRAPASLLSERAPPAHLPVYTSPPMTVPSDNGPLPPRPLLRAAVLNAVATVHAAEYAVYRPALQDMLPSEPPVYPLCANPLETVDRSSDALQLHELVSASTKWQNASSCFMALLFANGITSHSSLPRRRESMTRGVSIAPTQPPDRLN